MTTTTHTSTPAPYQVASPPFNGLAIASFVLALFGFAIFPVIFGHIALGQIKRRGERGTALAVIGVVLGYLQIALVVIALLALGIGAWGLWNAGQAA